MGDVIHEEDSDDRLREDATGGVAHSTVPLSRKLGWAQIMVHDQGDPAAGIAPIFEGAFSVDGVLHHVSTAEKYHRNKHFLNADIEAPEDARDRSLVIFRDTDMMSHEEEAEALLNSGDHNGVPPRSCSHDTLPFNTDAQHPVLLANAKYRRQQASWYDPTSLFESKRVLRNDLTDLPLVRRDDVGPVGNGNMTNKSVQNACCRYAYLNTTG